MTSAPAEGERAAAAPPPGRAFVNPLAGPVPGLPPPDPAVVAFHRRLPGYAPTPLYSVPRLARRLGVGELLVKCDSSRFGLPAFKMLGASWATYGALSNALRDEFGEDVEPWHDLDELAARLKPLLPLTLVAATDGNHGRAVAHMARLLGLGAHILVPAGTSRARMDAISQEGAAVDVVDGGYDDAVARSAAEADARHLVVSDTSWPGYDEIPRRIIEGYATMFLEVDDALGRARHASPDAVVVPLGVGALGAAAVVHYRQPGRDPVTLVGVEPTDAACVTASAREGHLVTLAGEQRSIMAGLNCGTPSPVAWPIVSKGLDLFVTIGDEWARQGVRDLAAAGIEAGETGAAAYGGLAALAARRVDVEGLDGDLGPGSSVLVLVTEGASDRAAWLEILGVEILGS